MNEWISGASAIACAAIGGFFLRYWRHSQDRLFMLFGVAFWLFAANRVALSIVGEAHEARTSLYVVRLVAFLLILVAIVDKNRKSAQNGTTQP